MEVPLPLAFSRELMSFFTFQISMFFSASVSIFLNEGLLVVQAFGRKRKLKSIELREGGNLDKK